MQDGEPKLPDDPKGDEIVLLALRELSPPIEVSEEIAADLDLLAEVLLDARPRLPIADFLYCLTVLLVEDFDGLAHDRCESEHLLLNTLKVAEDCIACLYSGLTNQRRRRPYSSWKHQITAQSVERCRWEDGMADHQDHNGSLAEVTTATLVVTLNRLERDARAVLWLSWVEYRQQDEIARRTGFPLERVEWLLDRTLQQVREACGMGDLGPEETISDDDIHKWLEGGESERGE